MCAITGILGISDPSMVEKSAKVMRHRGPDDFATKNFTLASFAFCRLSILDIKHGRQPMTCSDDKVTIVFNGEIYNFLELKENLKNNYAYQTESDTEVMLAQYVTLVKRSDSEKNRKKQIKRFLNSLEGMFAIAIYDERITSEPLCLLARDPFGKKPLFFHIPEHGKYLFFSSEVKGIYATLGDKGIRKQLNHSKENLSWYKNHDEQTHFEGIFTLKAGCFSVIYPDKDIGVNNNSTPHRALRQEQYWNIDQYMPTTGGIAAYQTSKTHQYRDQLSEKIEHSVKLRTRSDRKIGLFLSGGIDSSVIAIKLKKLEITPDKIYTVVVENDDQIFSEYDRAYAVAEGLGFEHLLEKVVVTKADIIRYWDTVIEHLEDCDPRTVEIGFLNYFLAKRAAEDDVVVVLTGEGGDEVFCGYRQFYREDLQANDYAHKINAIRKDFILGLSSNHLLHKDRMGMAHGVEIRTPLLDKDLVEYALGLNPRYFTQDGLEHDRLLLREMAEEDLKGLNLDPDIINPHKGYIHIELGLPALVCQHMGVPINHSLERRYRYHEQRLIRVFGLGEKIFNYTSLLAFSNTK